MAIASQTDRRVKYDKQMRDEGFTRVAIWVHKDLAETFRELALKVRQDGVETREEFLRAISSNAFCMAVSDREEAEAKAAHDPE